MAEEERRRRGGNTFNEAIKNVIEATKYSYSTNFPKSRKLPGIVRSFQDIPFKLMLGNYDQLRLGAEYLNKTAGSFICIDSSGKFWAEREKKGDPKKLNSVLVIPPIEKGQSPFPIFEQISESNRTIDFLGFLQYAYHYMRESINNQEVKNPTILITDISFANIHSVLDFFNKMRIKDYLKLAHKSLINKVQVPVETIITICESHLLPALLKSARAALPKKVLADTLIAGILVMLRAHGFDAAHDIWKNLVKVHCSKVTDRLAQDCVKNYSKSVELNFGDEDSVNDFGDGDEEPDEVVKYGKREAIRANSPFFHLFQKAIDKVEEEERYITTVSNPFYCPDLVKMICKQYLALYPLMSACVLPQDGYGLRNNAYVELYWQELRRIFSKIPRRQLWPPQYLGMLHEEIKQKATEIILRKFIPNLRTGGKARQRAATFVDDLEDDDSLFKPGIPVKKRKHNVDPGVFKPKPLKKSATKQKENYNESFESWDKRTPIKKKPTYMKNREIDYSFIEEDNFKTRSSKKVVRGPGALKGLCPQAIEIEEERLDTYLNKGIRIDNEAVDAALSLIDRKLSEDCMYVEGVTVYNNTALRLISTGDSSLIKNGPFLAIFPRILAIVEETEQAEALGRGEKKPDLDIGHFTLMSNIHCEPGEVNVYETLPAFRSPSALLTKEQKALLKRITYSEFNSLKINCINVNPQRELECGAISFGLAVKLCFTAPDEKSVQESFVDVRRDFTECLRTNDLVEFQSKREKHTLDQNEILFSIKI